MVITRKDLQYTVNSDIRTCGGGFLTLDSKKVRNCVSCFYIVILNIIPIIKVCIIVFLSFSIGF